MSARLTMLVAAALAVAPPPQAPSMDGVELIGPLTISAGETFTQALIGRTPQGTTFDGSGIPPDIAVPVFADQDVAAGRDPGMARALEVLRAARSGGSLR